MSKFKPTLEGKLVTMLVEKNPVVTESFTMAKVLREFDDAIVIEYCPYTAQQIQTRMRKRQSVRKRIKIRNYKIKYMKEVL